MNHVKILWEKVNFPVGLGRLMDIRNDETAYSLGDLPGIVIYKGNEKTLEYYDCTNNPDINIIKRVIAIVSLWVEKIPSKIKIPPDESRTA